MKLASNEIRKLIAKQNKNIVVSQICINFSIHYINISILFVVYWHPIKVEVLLFILNIILIVTVTYIGLVSYRKCWVNHGVYQLHKHPMVRHHVWISESIHSVSLLEVVLDLLLMMGMVCHILLLVKTWYSSIFHAKRAVKKQWVLLFIILISVY